ncbi:hypothetical protein FK85_31970 [Halorubrum saccharovorum]|uniref:Uncharacterized protein n=1 Tax=Halorubrum saccharovorum TaxID=2248 RepID=A0A0F8AX02_9EURY|nr:hypothetical protein FK85_31970 [Halorubrum saccharovorum]
MACAGERPEGANREGPSVPLAAGGEAAGDARTRESARRLKAPRRRGWGGVRLRCCAGAVLCGWDSKGQPTRRAQAM